MKKSSCNGAVLAFLLLWVLGSSNVLAQNEPSTVPDSALYPFNPGLLWTELGLSVLYDTNFELIPSPLAGPGLLADIRTQLRTSTYRPLIRLEYRGQIRQYKASAQWNREAHSVLGVMEQRLGPLGIEAIGSWQLNSETEDREIADVYSVSPRVSLRFGSARLRGFVRYWARRFAQGSAEEETIRTLGGDLRWRLFGFMEWRVGLRYEEGESNSPYRRFDRQTVFAGSRLNFSDRTALILEAGRRDRVYPDRTIEVEGVDISIREVRWTPGIYISHGSTMGPEVRIGYEYQVRESNDVRREYFAHRAIMGLRVPLFSWDPNSES